MQHIYLVMVCMIIWTVKLCFSTVKKSIKLQKKHYDVLEVSIEG